MKRLCIAFALVILTGRVDAQDNVRYVTNNVLALSASANPLSYYRDFDIRLKVLAKRGGSVQNLTNTFIRWVILDKRDMQESVAVDGYIIGDPANGLATAVASMRDLEPGAYQGVMSAYDVLNSNKVADLSLNDITLSTWCSDCSDGTASLDVRRMTGDYIGASTGEYESLSVSGDLTISGSLNVGDSIEALDSTKVLKEGETDPVVLTGTYVRTKYPTDPDHVATKQYVDDAAGGALNIGSVQLTTNGTQVGYTNSSGYFVSLPGFALPGGNGGGWLYISDYSTDTIVSNRNIGTVSFYVTNNMLAGLLPNETASLRMVDYRDVPAGVNLRAAVEWVQRPQRGKAATAGQIRSGLAWTTTANNTSYLWGAQSSGNTEPLWKMKQFAFNFGLQGDIYGNAPYDSLLQSFLLSEFPHVTWDLIDWDTNGIVRGYCAAPDAHTPTLLHLMTNAAFGQAVAGFAIGLNSDSAATGRATNVPWQVRRFLIGEGLWIDQSYR